MLLWKDVRTQSAAVQQMAPDWQLVEDLLGGTRAMRAAAERHLPKWPAEDKESYKFRLSVSVLFPAYYRTISVLVGKPFAKSLTIGDDVPPRVAALLEDVDLMGANLDVFASRIAFDALAYGLCGILVDMPAVPAHRTLADEIAARTRPYFLHIRPQQILGWRIGPGGTQVEQLRLLEVVAEPDGEFGERAVEQVRVLEPGRWRTFRKALNSDVAVESGGGPTTMPVVPFVPVYGRKTGQMTATPPMLDLAFTNIEHYQSASDQQTILHVARVPLLFGRMLSDIPISIGPGSLVNANDAHADLRYVEHSGAAIEAGRRALLDLEDRMRQIGAELLVIKPGNITESQTLADNEQGSCDLQRITQSVERSLDEALALMGQWIGEPAGGHVTIFRDFGAATLAEASAELLAGMESRRAISRKTLFGELKRRGILGPEFNIDAEIAEVGALSPVANDATQAAAAATE